MDDFIANSNTLLNKLYTSIKSEGYTLLTNISNIDVDIFEKNPLKTILSKNGITNYSFLINLVIVGIILWYASRLLLSLYNISNFQNIYFFVLKLILIAIISFNSFSICKEIVNLNAIVSSGLEKILENSTENEIDYNFLDENIDSLEEFFKSTDKISFNGFRDFIVCAYLISLLLFFSIRYVIVLLCIIVSPFTILSLIYNTTIFRVWTKIFILNLIVQWINKVIIFIPIVSKDEKDIYSCILIGSILLMYKIVKEIGGLKVWKE